MDHVCVGEVRPVLMMELASLMFHWSRFYILVLFFYFIFDFGGVVMISILIFYAYL